MNATDSIAQLQLDARRLQQALRATTAGMPAFQQLGQQLQQKLTAIHEAQQELLRHDVTR